MSSCIVSSANPYKWNSLELSAPRKSLVDFLKKPAQDDLVKKQNSVEPTTDHCLNGSIIISSSQNVHKALKIDKPKDPLSRRRESSVSLEEARVEIARQRSLNDW